MRVRDVNESREKLVSDRIQYSPQLHTECPSLCIAVKKTWYARHSLLARREAAVCLNKT